ncbi:acetyltransferase [Eubacterium sp. 1001713B170207_170306_E7]|uniref:acetyltransferase n=1 Tax=Eubacterium sp. 1001713B170207_170306_E7 TaxID=2787097 RepID=UPI00189937EE|nr:acetyltransferase [Eubacterium sp. 1001713B170207_170306_E7]
MPEKKVMIIGASGHGKVIADIVHQSGDKVLGFLDDDPAKKEIHQIPVLGKIEDTQKYKDDYYFIIGIGNNKIRKEIAESNPALNYYTAIHPTAVIGEGVRIGNGTAVMAGVVINADAEIKKHCIINTSAVIEHECVIGDYTHVSPQACLCGNVHMGEACHVGAGANVIQGKIIVEKVVVSVGSVVVKDLTEAGTYVGIPAKLKERRY